MRNDKEIDDPQSIAEFGILINLLLPVVIVLTYVVLWLCGVLEK